MTPEQRQKALEAARAAPKGPRLSRREKMAVHAASFAKMRRTFPKMALPMIAQAEKGCVPAMVKLKCLECSCWVRQEVRDCSIIDCGLYPVRPYQKLTSANPNDPGGRGVGPLEH